MTIQQQLSLDLKDAMRNREALKLETIRSIKTAFTNELVSKGRTPQSELSDDEAMTVLRRLHKQRLEAADQFSQADRQELADKELAEAEILSSFLPEPLDDDALAALVDQVLEKNPEADKSKMGIIIGQVIALANNRADGKRVQTMVAARLS